MCTEHEVGLGTSAAYGLSWKCILGTVSGARIGTESSETLCAKPGTVNRPTGWQEDQESEGHNSVQN